VSTQHAIACTHLDPVDELPGDIVARGLDGLLAGGEAFQEAEMLTAMKPSSAWLPGAR
jgi:hypothetical protein